MQKKVFNRKNNKVPFLKEKNLKRNIFQNEKYSVSDFDLKFLQPVLF